MIFESPYWLLLLALLPFLVYHYKVSERNRHISLMVSRGEVFASTKTWVVYAREWLQWLRWLVFSLIIIALARPQVVWSEVQTTQEGVDMMLVVDVSPSMLSKDVFPDRLSAVKKMANELIERHKQDRIGLTIFAGGAFNQCPLTSDHRILSALISNIQVGRLPEGTAIGTGLATAINHLKDSTSLSKVIVLISDGDQNMGEIGPLEASLIARALGIKIYIIGIGKNGLAEVPAFRQRDGTYGFGSINIKIDTVGLSKVATAAGGKFYWAQSTGELQAISKDIDQLETSELKVTSVQRVTDLFFWFLNAALSLLLLEILLRWGPLRVITV